MVVLFSHWVVSDSFATLWTIACQSPLSIEFPRQEYWSGLPFVTPRDLSNPFQKTDSLEKTLMLGKIEGRSRRGRQRWNGWDGWMASLIQWTWVCASSRRFWRTGKPGVLQSMGSQRVGHDWVTEQRTTPRDLPNPEIKPVFLCLLHWQADSLPLSQPESPQRSKVSY